MEAARQGASVVAAARTQERLDSLVNEIQASGGEAIAVRADVTVDEDRRQMFETACREFGGLDILINNAGVAAHGHFIDLDSDILRKTMEVNFFAVAECCRLAIPILTEGSQPLIINISSMAGRRGVPAWSEYSASKFAVCGFSEALRAELARFDIDLMLVVPGLTSSDFGEHLLARKGRMPANFSGGLSPQTVAERILAGARKNKKELRLEKDARLLLLVNWMMPRFVDRQMAKVVRKLYAKEIAELRERKAEKSRPVPAASIGASNEG